METPGEERNGELSPDGRWLAYEGESHSSPGQLDVYVRRGLESGLTRDQIIEAVTHLGFYAGWTKATRP